MLLLQCNNKHILILILNNFTSFLSKYLSTAIEMKL
jgi:hypothetical protein